MGYLVIPRAAVQCLPKQLAVRARPSPSVEDTQQRVTFPRFVTNCGALACRVHRGEERTVSPRIWSGVRHSLQTRHD